jgi:MoxR-like ATPase
MTDTVDTIRALLDGAIDETDDPETNFKLRSALQLLAVVEERDERLQRDLRDVELPEGTASRLRELGYLD